MEKLLGFLSRHRISLQDLTVLLAALLVGAFLVFEFDVYLDEGRVSPRQEEIEFDEAMVLAALLASGLLIFSIRRYREQRRETRRRHQAEQQVRAMVFQDGLTGLANRRRFDLALKAACESPPSASAVHAVFLMDLNGFKQVNDRHGHGVGDEVLVVAAQRILSAAREGDLVARFGGDEFALLATHLSDPEAASTIARRILNNLREPIVTGAIRSQISAGIGIALMPKDALAATDLQRQADVALYRAKAERGGAWRFYEESMDRQIRERDQLEQALRAALDNGQVEAYYQPSIDLQTQAVIGFEVMPRWTHPTLGELSRERILPIAEACGLALELTLHLLSAACVTARHWPPRTLLTIEIVPSLLHAAGLQTRMLETLSAGGFDPARLELEIAESALVQRMDAARESLHGLREAGVKIALGKFGTGYSSLYHLRNFTLDRIKIDRSFIESMASEGRNADIVSALVGLGQGLGLAVTADGISDGALQRSLLDLGCRQGQGQFFSSPVRADQTAAGNAYLG